MSQTSNAEPSQGKAPSTSTPTISRPPNPFAKFDDRIAAVCDRILPKQPYLVTVPSTVPYRKHSSDANRWFVNTPFSRKEEQLQYMSLLTHQHDDETLLKVDGTRIDEDGRLLAPQPSPRSEAPSRPETPSEAGPKKKITLKDYKSKDRSGVNTPETKPADDIRKQAIKSHKEEVDAKRVERSVKDVHVAKPEREPVPSKQTMTNGKVALPQAHSTPTQQDKESQRPAKKRRLSVEEAQRSTPVPASKHVAKLKSEASEKRTLPSLLSPEMPTPERKKQKSRSLPVLLSPKLPEPLEKVAKPVPARSDEIRNIMASAVGSPARTIERKTNDLSSKDAAGRIRSESQSSRPATPGITISSPVSKPAVSLTRPGTPLANGRTASPRPRQMHRICLKFSKKNRKRYEMLVKVLIKEKKVVSVSDKVHPASPKPVAKNETPKSDKQRAPEPSSEQPSKKAKIETSSSLEIPGRSDVPSTPKNEASDKHKPAFSTPKKDLKSTLMSRVPSTDTLDASTPSQDIHRSSTPTISSNTSQSKASPGPSSAPAKNDESWNDVAERIHKLGRVLKKEGAVLLGSDTTGDAKKRGVVLLVEGLLCFMLHSAALGQWRTNTDQAWASIMPYFYMVHKQSRPHKHLNGLVIQLGAVCRQQLQCEQLRRLSKETLPDDHIGSAPTPGSDGNTKTTDDNNRKQKFLELRDELVSNSRDLRIAWLEGQKSLPMQVLETDYPATCRKKTKDISKRNPDKPNLKDLSKEYYLPMDMTTNAFEATNFALTFMWEWAMLENVTWKTRIEL